MGKRLLAFLTDESGSTAMEYGLIAAGIGVVIITSVNQTGCALSQMFWKVDSSIRAAR